MVTVFSWFDISKTSQLILSSLATEMQPTMRQNLANSFENNVRFLLFDGILSMILQESRNIVHDHGLTLGRHGKSWVTVKSDKSWMFTQVWSTWEVSTSVSVPYRILHETYECCINVYKKQFQKRENSDIRHTRIWGVFTAASKDCFDFPGMQKKYKRKTRNRTAIFSVNVVH